ncbi:hypothetical protein HPP92_021048 [Vanilla planifolia]|uniref:Uncharacterized protein n=1 Tax=Vanilla planifolia TaxID=51239 RepID=A0A835Q416_VANPL|nr:hypothetical protein HPP92_021048 [Vanilla planifolia]
MADDMSEGMQCSDHPYRSNPGGVCAFCLQEKLGKLVSSKSSDPFFAPPPPSSSSSSPPSFQSSHLTASASIRMSFLSTKSRCSKSKPLNSGAVALKRSKSVAPQHLPAPLLNNVASNSPRKKSFSFLPNPRSLFFCNDPIHCHKAKIHLLPFPIFVQRRHRPRSSQGNEEWQEK